MSSSLSFGKDSREKQMKKAKEKREMLNAKLINARKQRNSNVDSESSINAKLNKARKAKADKQLHKEYNDLKRQKQKLKKGKQNKNLCYSRFQSADASPDPSPDPLIIEKVKNSQRAKSRRRFSMRTIKIAAILIMISLPCYQMLRRFDIWPSRQTVKSRLQTTYIVKASSIVLAVLSTFAPPTPLRYKLIYDSLSLTLLQGFSPLNPLYFVTSL